MYEPILSFTTLPVDRLISSNLVSDSLFLKKTNSPAASKNVEEVTE